MLLHDGVYFHLDENIGSHQTRDLDQCGSRRMGSKEFPMHFAQFSDL